MTPEPLGPVRRTLAAMGQTWDDDLPVVFERFRVVWPPEVADPVLVGGVGRPRRTRLAR